MAARSVTQAQGLLGLTWDQVQAIQERAVTRGLRRRELAKLRYVGIDEKSFGHGQSYVSLLSDLEGSRVLEVARGRDQVSTDALWQAIPAAQRATIEAVALDMWDPYLASTRQHVAQADVVHDKFHVAKTLAKAVDDVRKREHRGLLRDGLETLKHTKYLWLTNPEAWTPAQEVQFDTLKHSHLKVGRAWAIKEAFRDFWSYVYPGAARNFFRDWHFWATHSRLRPMIEAARTLRRHLTNLLTYLKHRITNAVAEGFNSKVQTIKSNARGFRNFEHYRFAILFHCGRLNLYPR
jgi:transposase